MGLKFKVNPAVLIPRPETEFLVEKIIEQVNITNIQNPSIIDIGTGSGCIAVSLAHHITDSQITATDVSNEALDLAKSNASLNEINNLDFIHHDILNEEKLPVKNIDIIVSNPPYVSATEMNDLPQVIKNFEPEIALTDYDSGLQFYEKILSLIDKDLKCKFVFMEMNASLKQQIVNLTNSYNFKHVEVIPDLNNLPRILKIEM
jgi:release factor glutamine methyltransferase